ncbi:BNR repeat-containing protein [Lewinella sp. IMCC34183]|uniref:BNR repeat-containing protein n=1 Tax=Lewinella sp. IMCC34183 TaxID=2248762 RepID=UPI000E250C70|nr:BNR repeat-containing protein [Lewinella sp. IMCC34183]
MTTLPAAFRLSTCLPRWDGPLLLLVLLTLASCGIRRGGAEDGRSKEAPLAATPGIKQRITVDSVPAAFPVNFSQDVAGNHHYIAYYDVDHNFSIAYRTLDEKVFHKTVLDSRVGWDSHNYTELIVDRAGYIHVSGNMHIDSLFYWRSVRPYDASAFTAIHYMTGEQEVRTTYPHFLQTEENGLLFHYRYGGSGNGYEVYNQWQPETKTWTRFLQQPLIDGEGLRNAYMQGPFYEKDGNYHLYWVWRETPDCATNHTFSYARSPDLKHWESAGGTPVAFPITFGAEALYVDPSDTTYGTGMLNGVQAHTLDTNNRIVLCNMKYDAAGNSQLYAYRPEAGGHWLERQVTDWDYRFQFSGWGSILFEIQLKGMRTDPETGRIIVAYDHVRYGEGEIVLDPETLTPLSVRPYAPPYPSELETVTTAGTFPKPVVVNINQDDKFILRWETLGENNDRVPEPPYPDGAILEFIELEE